MYLESPLPFSKPRMQPCSDASAFTSPNSYLFLESKGKIVLKGKRSKEYLSFFPDKPIGSYLNKFLTRLSATDTKIKED